ncbi:MAG: GNAT family N-acetyltransferase [Oscillospiraceae bacterium]|nr:GNAT family N-acetyltransferase [Oscillospiraceae bacterium]
MMQKIDDIGYLEYQKAVDVIDIVDIFVEEKERRKGYGEKMLSELITQNPDCEFFLEVRVNNLPAVNLYKKLLFEIINIRKKYYNNEDAYLMKKEKKCLKQI